MRGRPGPGAAIGLAVGIALVALVIWLPAAMRGDFYGITDPLVYMGLPMMIVGTAVGALIGVPSPPATGPGLSGLPRRSSRTSNAVVAVVAVTAAFLATWFFLMATGTV